MKHVETIIKNLKLEAHPEGGFFREVYRSNETVRSDALPERFTEDHCFSTAIYFLLEKDDFSAFHQIRQDEIWHHYEGCAVDIHMIDKEGKHSSDRLGKDLLNGEHPQTTVREGVIFGASVVQSEEYDYALVGCTVAPGFEFTDFKLYKRKDLLENYPHHKEIIYKLTRE